MLMRLGTALCLPSGVPFPLHAQGKAVPAPETLQRGLRSKGGEEGRGAWRRNKGETGRLLCFFLLFIYLFIPYLEEKIKKKQSSAL